MGTRVGVWVAAVPLGIRSRRVLGHVRTVGAGLWLGTRIVRRGAVSGPPCRAVAAQCSDGSCEVQGAGT